MFIFNTSLCLFLYKMIIFAFYIQIKLSMFFTEIKKSYSIPEARIVLLSSEVSFLQSAGGVIDDWGDDSGEINF